MSRSARRAQRAVSPASIPTGANLLVGKVFTSDVADSSSETGNPIARASDQDTDTRWISEPTSPVNITADFGGVYDISQLVVTWAADTIKNYTIAVSTDGSTWTTITTGITNNTQKQTVSYSSFSATAKGRYIRITGTDRWNASYGNSIWEVEAYGTLDASFPVGTISSFVGTATSDTAIDLSWNYSGTTLTNFTLRRNSTVIASPAAAARTYNDTGLSAGTNYTYTITANYSAGGTSNTASASATTQGGIPSGGTTIIMWHHRWAGPALRDYPADVKNNLNHYSLGMAQSSQSGTGYVSYSANNGQSNADHATDIRALVASGKPVVIGLGGAGAGGVTVTNSTQAQQMVSSVQTMVNNFGINGIDIDLESGSSSWTASALREVCLSLKSIYGSGFVVGVTTQMYGQYTAMWMNFLNTLGHNNYDYTGPMLYDFPESRKANTLIPVCLDKMDTMISASVPQNKICLGFMLQPAGNPNYSASENAQVILDSYNATKAQYPDIQGAFFWADDIDPGRNWEFSRQVAPYL